MKNLPALLLAAIVLLFAQCKEDSPCGPEAQWYGDVNNDLIYNDYDVITNSRTLIYEDLTTPEDICPDEHVKVYFNIRLYSLAPLPDELIVRGKAYWGLYEDEVTLAYDTTEDVYLGSLNVGLKQAFGEDPAWLGLQVVVHWPSTGTFEQDTANANNLFFKKEIELDYYKFTL